jgi:hypothetical protein
VPAQSIIQPVETIVTEVQSDTPTLEQVRWHAADVSAEASQADLSSTESPAPLEDGDRFEAVCELLQELLPAAPQQAAWDSSALEFGPDLKEPHESQETQESEVDSLEADLGQTVCDLLGEVHSELSEAHEELSVSEKLQAILGEQPECVEVGYAGEKSRDFPAAPQSARPYRNLFSQLRRKQQGLL